MEKQYVVGVDVGGQTSKIGVVNARGEILSRLVIRSDSYGKDSGAYISALAEAIRACVAECGKTGEIRGVGVGAPNSNYYTGQISYATNIEWAADGVIDFAKLLSESLGGVAVSLTNDANAAAMGVMILLSRVRALSVYGVSVGGAAAHNCGQVAAAVLTLGNTAPLYYLPVLLGVSLFTGAFTGLVAAC